MLPLSRVEVALHDYTEYNRQLILSPLREAQIYCGLVYPFFVYEDNRCKKSLLVNDVIA